MKLAPITSCHPSAARTLVSVSAPMEQAETRIPRCAREDKLRLNEPKLEARSLGA